MHPERDEASVVCEDKMSVLGVHTYRMSIRKASTEQLSRQLVEQQMLYGTLYGTSSEVRVISLMCEDVYGSVRNLKLEVLCGKHPNDLLHLQTYDTGNLRLGELVEIDYLVNTVEELGAHNGM